MKTSHPAIAAGLALLTATGALGSVWATSTLLKRAAARTSRRLPVEERLFEPATVSTPELRTRGRTLYLDSCAHCHGADARGDEGPDLHGVQVSDRYIQRVIRLGIPHEMPAFEKKHDAADIAALLAYVRSL